MAVAVKPSNSLLNIRSGIKSIKASFSGLRKNAGNLNDVMLKKTKVKRESIARNYILSQRRQENERRKNKEDLLEASSIGGAFKRQAKVVASSTKGFLGRIMDFLGTLLVGWLLTNLPSIITMAQELIARIQRLYTIVTGFLSNTVNLFRGFGNLLGAVSKNILTFDFTDSKGRVDGALKDLGSTFEDMQSQFDEGFKLLTTSLGEGVVSGEDAQPFGTQYENESMQQQPSGGTSGGGGTVGTKEQRAMLDAISYAEGTKKSYGTIYGGKVVPELERGELTVGQVLEMQKTGMLNGKSVGYAKDRYNSDATGRYQFMSYTLREEIGKQGISLNEKFTPALQDKIILNRITKMRGVTPELLKKEGLSAKVSNMLSPEFASLPTYSGVSYYGQPVKSLKSIQNAYQQSLGTQSTPTPTPQPRPTQTTAAPSTSFAPVTGTTGASMGNKPLSVPYSPFKPGSGAQLTSGKGLRWGRMHKGYDIAAKTGTPLYAYFPGKVTHIGLDGTASSAGYGNWVVWKDDIYGAYHFFGHMRDRPAVRVGQVISQGTLMGYVGSTGESTGPHLHWEISNNPPASNGQFTSYEDPGAWLRKHPLKPGTPSIQSTPAQITSSGTQQRRQASQQLAQQQAGPSIIIIEEEPPAQQPQVSGGGGAMMIPIVINPLNSFITKKLLLDLAYT